MTVAYGGMGDELEGGGVKFWGREVCTNSGDSFCGPGCSGFSTVPLDLAERGVTVA